MRQHIMTEWDGRNAFTSSQGSKRENEEHLRVHNSLLLTSNP
jgi:hypothetical protein